MAVLIPILRTVSEKPVDFNKRLFAACQQEDQDGNAIVITDASLTVVDGMPLVTLISETIEASEEDVEEADDEEKLEVGDIIPNGPGLIVQVLRLEAETDDKCAAMQNRLNALAVRFGGEVIKTLTATGTVIALVEVRDSVPTGVKDVVSTVIRQVPIRKDVTFMLLAYDADVGAAEGEGGDEEDLKERITGKHK